MLKDQVIYMSQNLSQSQLKHSKYDNTKIFFMRHRCRTGVSKPQAVDWYQSKAY